jgi:uncharacterized lipoprotein YddW (UPF0748 family)
VAPQECANSLATALISPLLSLRLNPSMRIRVLLSVSFFVLLGAYERGLGASSADPVVIDDAQYATDRAAQSAWEPMRGTAPVRVTEVDGRKAVQFACDFSTGTVERACWDRKVNLDLSSCRGVELKVLCRDATPVSYFSIYFQSGDGWYHGAFYPETAAGWNTITLDKASMTMEGRPAGWQRVNAIRLSAWRAKDVNTEFYLGGVRKTGLLGVDATVAIIRGDSAAQHNPVELRNVEQYAKAITQQFDGLHIGCVTLSDLELAQGRLSGARLVVLPYNPSIAARAESELIRYVQSGGSLLAFYTIPDGLRAPLGIASWRRVKAEHPAQFSTIHFRDGALPGAPTAVQQQSWNVTAVSAPQAGGRVFADWLDDKGQASGYPAVVGTTHFLFMTHVLLPGDTSNQARMLLAMAGYLAPGLWRESAEASLEGIGMIGRFRHYEDATCRINELNPDNSEVNQRLAAASASRTTAQSLATHGRYAEAIDEAAAATRQLTEAFCRAQKPVSGEFRGFWCHSAFGVEGLDWDEAVHRLSDNGFTAILANMLWGGAAFYDSKVLPMVPQVDQRGDQVALCLAACRKYGVQLHVWKVNWNLGHAAPKEFVERMRRERRLQADSQGKEELWLCPSAPENQKLEIDSMVELVRRYGVDGIHFDYIRYPDGDHCFCASCRERFQRDTHTLVRRWPQDVLDNSPGRTNWLDWRRGNITAVVRAVSEDARALRPGIKISAAVFPNWMTDRDSVGQDWKLWCEKGYVDFVCPMDYTPSTGSFENMVSRQLPWANPARCYPGIGLSASTSQFGVDRLVEQISVTRRHETGGFVVFNYGTVECQEILPMLGLGITARH